MKGQLHLKMSQSGGVAQVAEHWTSKCEALSSSPIPQKKKKVFPIHLGSHLFHYFSQVKIIFIVWGEGGEMSLLVKNF
jgi:hypothetical protein